MAITQTAVSYYGLNYVEHAEKDFAEMLAHGCSAVILAVTEFDFDFWRPNIPKIVNKAREMGLTNRNLFVKANQHAFSLEDEVLKVDYSRLVLSMGDVPGVEATEASWTADNVLTVRFDRGLGNAFHQVYLFVYAPDLPEPYKSARGFLAAPVYRRDKRRP